MIIVFGWGFWQSRFFPPKQMLSSLYIVRWVIIGFAFIYVITTKDSTYSVNQILRQPCATPMLKNSRKLKSISMFPKTKSAQQGLIFVYAVFSRGYIDGRIPIIIVTKIRRSHDTRIFIMESSRKSLLWRGSSNCSMFRLTTVKTMKVGRGTCRWVSATKT